MKEKNPYSEGHDAYYMGHRLKDNPYKKFTEDWQEWRTGWQDEEKDDPYWRKSRDYIKNLRLKL